MTVLQARIAEMQVGDLDTCYSSDGWMNVSALHRSMVEAMVREAMRAASIAGSPTTYLKRLYFGGGGIMIHRDSENILAVSWGPGSQEEEQFLLKQLSLHPRR
jgi:hypothetical protein